MAGVSYAPLSSALPSYYSICDRRYIVVLLILVITALQQHSLGGAFELS